mmetsp:Transcript_29834/g.75931  ORF Transcript_29834/g.75931 Transcript_29834/m.75931 type:complete len:264 (-) Transcript_29834:171-962(-)
MVLVAAATVAVGVGGAGCASWKYIKPSLMAKIRGLVSQYGPEYLGGSKVDLADIEISVGSTTTVTLRELKIRNVEPYKADSLMELDELVIEINAAATALSKLKEVDILSITANGIKVTWEKEGFLHSNIQDLLQTLKKQEEEAGPSDGPETSVGKITMTDVKIVMFTGVLSDVQKEAPSSLTVKVPPIEIVNLKDAQPVTIVSQMVTKILMSSTSALVAAGLDVTDKLKDKVEHAAEEATSWFSSLFGFGGSAEPAKTEPAKP